MTSNTAPTFNIRPGTTTVNVGGKDDFASSVTVQSDGKLVVAGNSGDNFSLIRLNTDGTLDTSFSGDGKFTLDVGGINKGDYATSVTVQNDGKLVVAGTSTNSSGDSDFSLIRLNTDGTLDTSFSGDGKLTLDVGGINGSDYAASVTVQSDGKLVVAGSSTNSSGTTDFTLIRLSTNGTLDTSFRGDGKFTLDVGGINGTDQARSVTVQSDGKLVVAGNSGDNFSLIRLNTNGTPDTSFSGDGKFTLDVSGINKGDYATSVTVQSDGKLVVAGTSAVRIYSGSDYGDRFSLIRLNTDGTLDTSFSDGFSDGGKLLVHAGGIDDFATSVTVQSDGKLVVAGYSTNGSSGSDFSLIRLNTNGTLDTSFSGNGKFTLDVGGINQYDQATSATVQSDGKLVVAGRSLNSSDGGFDFSLIRLNTDGTLDTTFGISPSTLDGVAIYTENAAPVVLDSSVAVFDAELAALNIGAGNYAGASITLARVGGADAQDMFFATGALSFSGSNVVLAGATVGSFTQSAGTLAITFNASATQARVTQTLSAIGYSNTSDAPPASVQMGWTFSDGNTGAQGAGGVLGTTGITTVNITAVNDAPVISGIASAQGVTVGAAAALAYYTVAVADADGAAVNLTVTLTPTNGTLNGLTDANSSLAGIQLTGTAAQINTAIARATFTATATGAASIGFSVSDGVATAVAATYSLSATEPSANTAPTFTTPSRTGTTTIDVGGINKTNVAHSVTVQSDGKLVVAGYSTISYSSGPTNFSLIRLNTDGTLDTSFNSDGKFTLDVGGFNNTNVARSVTVQSDGKLVVAGYSTNTSGTTDFSLIRLNTNGTLDTSFSGDGKFTLDVGGIYNANVANSVTVQSDGKLVVAGYSTNSSGTTDFSLIRLNTDGTLDTTFSGDGTFTLDVGGINGTDQARSVTVQNDGKLVVAGYSTNTSGTTDFSLIRLNTNGTLDTTFSGDGKFTLDVGGINGTDQARSVTVQSDGKLVVAGYSTNTSGTTDFSLIRLNTNGTLDTSFSGDGKFTLDVGGIYNANVANSVTVQSDGKLVVAGNSTNSSGDSDFSLIRLNTNGTLDTSFSGDGKFTLDVSGINKGDYATSVTVQSDGKLVVAGYSGTVDFSLIRLNTDGTLDTTFGSAAVGGASTLDGVAAYTENAAPVVLDSSVAVFDSDLAALNSGSVNYAGASITLARVGGADAQDVFSATGALSFSGSNVVLAGVTVGSFTQSAGTLAITFNASATQARVTQTLSAIGYSNTSNAPPASVQIGWAFIDGNTGAQGAGGVLGTTGITTVNITAVNDAPVISGIASAQGVTVGTAAALADFTVADADGAAVNLTVTLTPTNGTLNGLIDANPSLAGIQLTGTAAQLNTAIASATFTATAAGAASIAVSLSDGMAPAVVRTYTLNATGGINIITGNAGNNPLTGTDGNDTLSGLGGNDTLNGGAGADSLDGGSGVDTASYADATTPVSVILYGGQAFGVSSGNDALTAIENILGTAYGDLIFGDAADNVLDGGAGNDTLDGALGNDTLLGQTGDDLLNGLAGNDSLDGGDGNDSLYGWADNDTLVGGIGTDRLFGGAGADRLDGGADADQLEGDDGADTLLGGAGNDTLRGWNDADSLDGGDGDNALFGGAGADSMQAGTGADQLEGDDGNDTIAGGAGNDTLRGWNDNDSLDGGDGNDALFGGAGVDAMMGGTGADQLEGDDGNDSIAGGTGNDTLRGWNDSDNLSGDDGDDLLVGWSGNDSLVGGNGNDSLFGDDGADTLVGGTGGDVLQGGLGNDLYTFATGFGFDGVRDYDYLAGNSDTFQFTGINRADLSFARVGDALKVERTGSGGADVIYVNDWYQAGSNGAFKIETWVMGDASVFTAAQIEALVV